MLFIFDLFFYNYNYNYINNNTNFNSNVFWKLLFYFNNNNNSLFIFIIILLTLHWFNFTNNNYTYMYLLFTILFINNINYIVGNLNNIYSNALNNISLINGILLIHPFFIYFTYVLIYKNIKINYFNKFNLNNSHIINNNYYALIIIAFYAIFLGSFWAQQELNWGGWWNWDYVELIALVFFLVPVYFVHIKQNKKILFYRLSFFKNLIIYYIIFYILIRCDILNSVHSFNSFNFLEKYLYYIYAIFILIILLFYFFEKLRTTRIFFISNYAGDGVNSVNITTLIYVYITLILTYIIYNIFVFLISTNQYPNSFIFLKILINLFIIIMFIYNTRGVNIWFGLFISVFFINYILCMYTTFYINIARLFYNYILYGIHTILIFLFNLNSININFFFYAYAYVNDTNYHISVNNNISYCTNDLYIDDYKSLLSSFFLKKLNFFLNISKYDSIFINNIISSLNHTIIYDVGISKIIVKATTLFYFFYGSFIFLFFLITNSLLYKYNHYQSTMKVV